MHSAIPIAALDRYQELQKEDQAASRILEQIGSSVPGLFTGKDSVIVNPSNVGVGMISRMIETDDTVSAAVDFKNLMVQAKIGEYHHEDKAVKQFVQDMLAGMRRPTWAETKEAQGSKDAYGFSISEMIFKLKGMEKTVQRIPTYHPATIAFEVDDSGVITEDGILQFVTQHGQFRNPNRRFPLISHGFEVKNPFTTPVDRLFPRRIPFLAQMGLARIPRNKVIHHVSGNAWAFGSPYGKTKVRTAHLAWQLKVFIMRQLGITSKRFGQPIAIGQAPTGQAKVKFTNTLTGETEELTPQQAMLKMIAAREQDDGLVTGPEKEGYKIEIVPTAGNLADFVAAINALNVWIFRCFLIPSLVMTDGSAGSRSLGDKHFQIVDRICDAEAVKFKDVLIHDFIERVILENFGPMDDYGTFKNRPQNLEERIKLGNMFSELVLSGIMKAYVKEDMSAIREELSLPEDKDRSFGLRDPLEGEVTIKGNPTGEKGETPRSEFNSSESINVRLAASVDDLKIQAFTFDRDKFSSKEALEWLAKNNHTTGRLDDWSDQGKLIAEIRPNSEFNSDSLRVSKVEDGVNIVVGSLQHTDE